MFFNKQRFKYKDLHVGMQMLRKGDYMFSFDLKSRYHHIDIAEVHQKCLGFAWRKKCHVFMVLPFGLCTVCYLFTKVVHSTTLI